jgi:pimeloyl-ACP methyl ester carboxylesterase
MATFVLVHGAWTGGWFWWRVGKALQEAGHQVIRPTLTGCGERSHLATPQTNLDQHIEDLANVLRYEDVHRVVLAGHGYGGMVITGAADREPSRIHHLVYVDALTPENGQSSLSIAGETTAARLRQAAAEKGDGWQVPLPFRLDEFGVTAEVDMRWLTHRLTPMPLAALEQPIALAGHLPPRTPRTFIHAAHSTVPPFADLAARVKSAARPANPAVSAPLAWRYHELSTGYFSPVTAPKELAALLLACAPQ